MADPVEHLRAHLNHLRYYCGALRDRVLRRHDGHASCELFSGRLLRRRHLSGVQHGLPERGHGGVDFGPEEDRGAVFGILLAFGMLFPNTLLYIYFAIPVKAKYFVMVYGALELYLGLSNNPADNVAHFAHLGGMLFGFLLLNYWQKNNTQFY